MKTKVATKQRKQMRESDYINGDLTKEFGDVLTDEFLDIDALAEIEDDDE